MAHTCGSQDPEAEFRHLGSSQHDDEAGHKRIHAGANRMFGCNQCGYRSKWKHHVHRHIRSIHNTRNPFKCLDCNYGTKSRYFLKKHIEKDHEVVVDPVKVFRCRLCGYCTTKSSRLADHEVVHSNDRPFECDVPGCGVSTKRKRDLRRHKERKHMNSTSHDNSMQVEVSSPTSQSSPHLNVQDSSNQDFGLDSDAYQLYRHQQ